MREEQYPHNKAESDHLLGLASHNSEMRGAWRKALEEQVAIYKLMQELYESALIRAQEDFDDALEITGDVYRAASERGFTTVPVPGKRSEQQDDASSHCTSDIDSHLDVDANI